MASLNRTCTETHPAPYPRHDPVNGYPGGQRSPPAAQQPVPAGWRSRMASLNRTCTETHPAPYPREQLPRGPCVAACLMPTGIVVMAERFPSASSMPGDYAGPRQFTRTLHHQRYVLPVASVSPIPACPGTNGPLEASTSDRTGQAQPLLRMRPLRS